MADQKEIFLHYPEKRDVVFVFGAGSSHSDGVPLQKQMLPKILSSKNPEIRDSEIGKTVIEFVNDNFAYDRNKNQYPQLEAVFGFLDYFIQQNESLNSKYPYSEILKIKEYLIKLIHYIVNLRTDKKSKYYHQFWQNVKKFNGNTSIITLNYDNLLEQSFDFLYQNFGYLDYCTHLMNFENEQKLIEFNFWINARKPIKITSGNIPIPIKIIKLHGSLNWKYCKCCNQLLLTTWDRKIDLNKGKFLGYTYPDQVEYEYLCPLDGTDFHTLIIPPSYIKSLNHPIISQLVSEASREIRATRKIVFVGYSLSNADVHIKALFKKHIHKNVEVIVINSRMTDNFKLSYSSLTRNIRFITKSFEEMVFDEELMKELLMCDGQ